MTPRPEEVLDALREDAGYYRKQAAEAADARRLPDETVRRLRESGVMRLIQPARYGGFEADPVLFCEAVLRLAEQCGATGWVTGVVGVHSWHLGLYDDSVQQEVWGDDPDTWISSSYAPSGTARRVNGGYRLSGRWSFSSGCDHCGWVFVGGNVLDEEGRPADYRHFLLPLADYRIDDVWEVAGLAGTGSNDIIVEETFVPDARSMSVADLMTGSCPGRAANPGPLFAVPWGTMFLNAVCLPVVGIAQAALDECVSMLRDRLAVGGPTVTFPSPVTLTRLAHASSDVDAARAQLLGNIDAAYRAAQRCADAACDDREVPLATRARARRDQLTAVIRAVGATDVAFEVAGSRSISLARPLQRMWRDAHAAQHHVVNLPDAGLTAYGTWMLTGKMRDPLV